jgi:hypothetical protein
MIAPVVILLGMAVSTFNLHLAALVYFSIPLFYLKHTLVDTSWQNPGVTFSGALNMLRAVRHGLIAYWSAS